MKFMKGHGSFLDTWSFAFASTILVIVYNGLALTFCDMDLIIYTLDIVGIKGITE